MSLINIQGVYTKQAFTLHAFAYKVYIYAKHDFIIQGVYAKNLLYRVSTQIKIITQGVFVYTKLIFFIQGVYAKLDFIIQGVYANKTLLHRVSTVYTKHNFFIQGVYANLDFIIQGVYAK